MALITGRDTFEVAGGGRQLVIPVKGGAEIFDGALVALDANGFAIPGTKEEGITAAGRAEEFVDNTAGTDGAVTVRVNRGVFVWENSATPANRVTAAQLLKPCYFEDDQTVSNVATGSSVAGKVIAVTDDGVAVETL